LTKEYADNLKWLFFATSVVILTTTFFVVFYLSYFIFLSGLIGVGVACLISPLIDYMENKLNFNRFLATLLFLSLIALLFLIVFYFSGSTLYSQIDSLKEKFPTILESWQNLKDEYMQKYPLLTQLSFKKDNPELTTNLMKYMSASFFMLMDVLTGLSLATVIALFTSANYKNYFTGAQNLLPEDKRSQFKIKAERAAKTLRKWFYAQFLDMCVVGFLTTIGLWIAGINYWALYGAMAGLLSIIPFAGLVFVFVLSGAIITVTQPEKLIALILVFVITQNIEGNFIMPKLMKDHVKIPAAPLLFLLILVGSWFGILGALVTTPLFAIVISEIQSRKKTKEI
jgi:predicted PurR-regulated permease PerM